MGADKVAPGVERHQSVAQLQLREAPSTSSPAGLGQREFLSAPAPPPRPRTPTESPWRSYEDPA